MRGGREKVDPADWFDREEIAQARGYNRALQRHTVAFVAVLVGLLVGLLIAKVPARVIEATRLRSWALQILAVAIVLSLAIEIVGAPLDAWLRAVRARWGFPPEKKGFVVSTLEDMLLTVVVLPISLLGIFALIRLTSVWWLPMALIGVIVAFVARLGLRSSRRSEPLQDLVLEERLRRLAREAGVRTLDLFVGRSMSDVAPNEAVLLGFGRRSRIVLAEDVLARPVKEVEVYLAQKLSSWRKGYALRKIMWLAVCVPLSLSPIALLVGSHRIQTAVGATGRSDPRLLPLFLLVFVPSVFVAGLLLTWQSRRYTRASDLDALNFTRDPEAFEAVVRNLYGRLHAELAPSFVQRLRSALPPPAERLALAARWREGRRVAVLFTDVEDATPLVERLGDEAWYDVLQDHNEILRKHVVVHRGREPASAGDGFLFVFDDVGAALICAVDIQRDLHRYATTRGIDLRVRMGVHTGEVIRKDDAVIGREVHVAARIAAAASGGQILASSQVRDAVATSGRFRFSDERELTLKGLSGTYHAFDVDWADAPTDARSLQPQR